MRAASTSSTTSRRCSRWRPGAPQGSAPVLFPPMPAVRYTPASDTSVLGNRVWVAPNQTVRRHPQLLPAGGRRVRRHVHRRRSSGADRVDLQRARRARREPNELESLGSLVVRSRRRGRRRRPRRTRRRRRRRHVDPFDPRRLHGAPDRARDDGRATRSPSAAIHGWPRRRRTWTSGTAWRRRSRRTECTLQRAVADLADVERRLASRPADATTESLRRDLRPVILALRGDPKDPGHVNLPVPAELADHPGREQQRRAHRGADGMDRHVRRAGGVGDRANWRRSKRSSPVVAIDAHVTSDRRE